MKKALYIGLTAILIIGFAYTLYFLYAKGQEKPIVFSTEQASFRDIVNKTVATGSVVPRKEIEIKPVVSGIVNQLLVEPGDIIKEGDPIAEIKVIPNMANLNNAEDRLERSRINLKNAEQDYKRNKELLDKQVIAPVEFQRFDVTYQNAKQELSAAKENLSIIKSGSTSRGKKYSNTTVRSTISGMVLDVPIEQGNSVIETNNFNEGTTIAAIADMSEMVFEGKVDESEVGKLKVGMALILKFGAIENKSFNATLEYIAPKGVEENGAIQFEIKAAVELDENTFIRAGYSANADVVLDRRDSVLALNEALLKFDEEGRPFVEVEVGDQKYERKDLTLGLSDGIYIEVLGGIDENTRIKAKAREEAKS